MRRLKPKTLRAREDGFTKQVTIWMRPERYETVKHLAIDERSTFQSIVDRALERYVETAEPAAAH